MSEIYDEIVFTSPKDEFFRAVMSYKKSHQKVGITGHSKEFYTVFDERSDVQQLTFIEDHILREIEGG